MMLPQLDSSLQCFKTGEYLLNPPSLPSTIVHSALVFVSREKVACLNEQDMMFLSEDRTKEVCMHGLMCPFFQLSKATKCDRLVLLPGDELHTGAAPALRKLG